MRRSRKWLLGIFAAVAAAWPPLVIVVRGGTGELAPQLWFALTIFVWLTIPAVLIWAVACTLGFLIRSTVEAFTARRITPGACRACGYSLRGNVSGVCPECGTRRDETGSNPPDQQVP